MFFTVKKAVAGAKRRRGQTAIEYLLVTISLLFVFVMMFKALQYSLANQFQRGGLVVIRMYTETPW
ncbi:MAG TPA: hypothetical protein DCS63_06630 [Elusimicrobia bacterium]|nr:hypothetical protein [Elusimicrobiota bacterium]